MTSVSFSLRRVTGVALLFLGALCPSLRAASAPETFDPKFNGIVHAVLVQTDGSIIMGGVFTGLHPGSLGAPQDRERLAKFNEDGSLDQTFVPSFSGPVRSLAMDAQGRLLVGGGFEFVREDGEVFERHGLARFNLDGSLDQNFTPQFDGEETWRDAVQTVAGLADGSIVVGGPFRTVKSAPGEDALARPFLVKIAEDGSIITDFNPVLDNEVITIAALTDGGFVAGGAFTESAGSAAGRLVRFKADGSRDAAWTVGADNLVRALAVDVDGSILIGGDFLNLRGAGETALQQQVFLARVSETGERESAFHPRPNARVTALAIEHSGSILVGGDFTAFLPFASQSLASGTHLARLSRAGLVDTSFRPGPSGTVKSIALQEDGGVVIGGLFTSLTDAVTGTSTARLFGARVYETGRVDSLFTVGTSATVLATAERPDGGIYVGGSFVNFAGETRYRLALINADGAVDAQFAPTLNGAVQSMALQPDGKLLIGGGFTTINDESQPYLARLNADGTLDTGFDPQPNGAVLAMLVEDSGQILVGGSFTGFSPGYDVDTSPDDYEGVSRAYLGRVNADGTIDESWTPSLDSTVRVITRQPNGLTLIGGNFSAVGTEGRAYLARIKTDGSPDETFDPSPSGVVYAIELEANGDIVFGGNFTVLQLDDGEADDDDGDDETDDDATRLRIARVHADGTLDKTFTAAFNSAVTSIRVLSDGDLLVGGDFTRYAPNEEDDQGVASSLIRLNSDGTRDADDAWQTNGSVEMLYPLANGDVLVGGLFGTVYSAGGASTQVTPSLVRYDVDHGVDTTWSATAVVDAARYVGALTMQRTGQVLVGGHFSTIAGVARQNVALFNSAGNVDASFNLRANGAVDTLVDRIPSGIWDTLRTHVAWLDASGRDLNGANYSQLTQLSGRPGVAVVEADGSILLGGYFTNTAGTSGSNLVRLRADGTFDPNFRPNPSLTVTDIALQDDGRIVIVGSFTQVAGVDRAYVARLWPDGSLDTTFTPKVSAAVYTVELQPDGMILIGGGFTTFNEDDGEGDDDDGDTLTDDDTRQAYLARLKSDGLLDRSFTPKVGDFVRSILVHASGDITIGGQFTTITSGDTTHTRSYLARLNSAGAVNESFNPAPNGEVWDLALQPDGKLIVAGAFTLFTKLSDHEDDDDDGDGDTDSEGKDVADEDADVFYLARLNADDSLDTGFDPRPNYVVEEVVIENSGDLLVRGDFGALFPNDAEYGLRRNGLARVTAAGLVDPQFNPNPDDAVYTMLSLADGRVLIGGDFQQLDLEAVLYLGGAFTTLDDNDLPYLGRIQSDGNPDGTYRPAPNAPVRVLSALPDGRLLVGGDFTQLFGQTHLRLARLTSNGLLDTGFVPSFNGPVRSIAIDQEGGAVIAGDFTQANGVARSRLARLWADGSLDTTWAPGSNGRIDAVAADLEGGMLVAGAFTQVNGTDQAYLARIAADGTLVSAFAPTFDGAVSSVVVRGDGRVVAGGAFQSVNGVASPGLVTLEADGSVFLASAAGTNGAVLALGVDREGRIMAGGNFTQFGGVSRALLARASGSSSFGQALLVDDDGTGVTWVQTGAAAAATSVRLALSTDGESWTELGLATRVTGADVWRWEGSPLPIDGAYLLRVRLITPSTRQGSSSLREYYRHFIGTAGSGYGYGSTLPQRFGTIGGDIGDWLPGGGGIVVYSGGVGNGDGSGGGGDGDDDVDVLGSRLRNLSTRVALTGSDVLTVGFVVEGAEPRRVLLRAVGPGLAQYLGGIEMTSPRLALRNAAGVELGSNTAWQSSAQMRSWFSTAGAFSLTPGSADAVLAPVLAPGAYTLAINDVAGLGGVVLAEVYDLGSVAVSDRLANLSALSRAGTGDDTFVVGFVIEGTASKRILVRAIGPALTAFGVTDALDDVALDVFGSGGALIASNDDWKQADSDGTLAASAQRVGAFALETDSKDAAVLVDLPPGVYTVQLKAKSGAGTQGLIEIYEVMP